MQRIILLLLATFYMNLVFAQSYTYKPIPTSNATWKMSNMISLPGGYVGSPSTYCFNNQYSFTGIDTTIGGNDYYQIESQERTTDPVHSDGYKCLSAFNVPMKGGNTSTIWMFENDKKIYLLDTIPFDTLLHKYSYYYDFGVENIGDQVGHVATDTVINIDTININGSPRRRIVSRSMYMPSTSADTIIEGIGSIRFGLGFKEMHNFYSAYPNANLICFTVNSTTEYNYNNSACADIWPLSIDEIINTNDTNPITPNPFINTLSINSEIGGYLCIYNMIGSVIHSQTIVQSSVYTIDASSWPPGMYFYSIKNGSVLDSGKLVKQ